MAATALPERYRGYTVQTKFNKLDNSHLPNWAMLNYTLDIVQAWNHAGGKQQRIAGKRRK